MNSFPQRTNTCPVDRTKFNSVQVRDSLDGEVKEVVYVQDTSAEPDLIVDTSIDEMDVISDEEDLSSDEEDISSDEETISSDEMDISLDDETLSDAHCDVS